MKILTGKLAATVILVSLSAIAFGSPENGSSKTAQEVVLASYLPVKIEVIPLNNEQIEKLRMEREKHRDAMEKISTEHNRNIASILDTKDL